MRVKNGNTQVGPAAAVKYATIGKMCPNTRINILLLTLPFSNMQMNLQWLENVQKKVFFTTSVCFVQFGLM